MRGSRVQGYPLPGLLNLLADVSVLRPPREDVAPRALRDEQRRAAMPHEPRSSAESAEGEASALPGGGSPGNCGGALQATEATARVSRALGPAPEPGPAA